MAQIIPLAEADAVLDKLLESSTRALVLVVSDKEEDDTYWCPDCEILKPLFPIFDQEAKAANLPFYVFVAGDRPTWMDPENELRKHKALIII